MEERRQKKPALNLSFGKPQNCINGAARDVKLPMLQYGVRPKPDKACFPSLTELCPKVENVEFTNFVGSMRDIFIAFQRTYVSTFTVNVLSKLHQSLLV
jgi:hypothetical protein